MRNANLPIAVSVAVGVGVVLTLLVVRAHVVAAPDPIARVDVPDPIARVDAPVPPPAPPTQAKLTTALASGDVVTTAGASLPLCGRHGPVALYDAQATTPGAVEIAHKLPQCPTEFEFAFHDDKRWETWKLEQHLGPWLKIEQRNGDVVTEAFVASADVDTPDELVAGHARVLLPLIAVEILDKKRGVVTVRGGAPADPCATEHCGSAPETILGVDGGPNRISDEVPLTHDPKPVATVHVPDDFDVDHAHVDTVITDVTCCT